LKKTIALVANTSWNLVHFRSTLAEQLRRKGYRVLAIAPPGQYSDRLLLDPFSRFYPWRLKAHGRNVFQEYEAALELRRLYRTLAPDLALHFSIKPNIYGSWAARGLGIPSISTVTGLGYPFLHPQGENRLVPFVYRHALRNSCCVVFQNEDDRALFLKKRIVEAGHAHLIPGSGVDTRLFQPYTENHRPEHFIFFFAGRLLRDKGIVEYLEAGRRIAAANPNVRFWIAGEIEPENPAALSARELEPYFNHPAFRYHGFLEDVRPVMAKADVFVLPSYREGMPRAVLEAMAMARPVITTDTAGCRDTVEPGVNGLLTPVKDVDGLTKAMLTLLKADSSDLAAMGARSREKAVALFDIQIINRQFLDLIDEVLNHEIQTRARSVVF